MSRRSTPASASSPRRPCARALLSSRTRPRAERASSPPISRRPQSAASSGPAGTSPGISSEQRRHMMDQTLSTYGRKPDLVTQDVMIPSDTAGISLHLRNKRPAALKAFSAERTILMMHGATYPSGSLFDAPLGGF